MAVGRMASGRPLHGQASSSRSFNNHRVFYLCAVTYTNTTLNNLQRIPTFFSAYAFAYDLI
jgi:hypothetical protein